MSEPFTIVPKNESQDTEYMLVGPDDLVWHSSWAAGPMLKERKKKYTRAYECGVRDAMEQKS